MDALRVWYARVLELADGGPCRMLADDTTTPAFDLVAWLTAVDARLARFEIPIRDALFVESIEDLVLIKETQFENIGIGGAILNKLMQAVAAAKVIRCGVGVCV